MSIVVGAYRASWGAVDVGIIKDGIALDWGDSSHIINSQELGESMIDGVYRGGNLYVSMVLQELNLAPVKNMLWPFAANLGEVGTPGVLLSTFAKELILTKIAGTNAPETSWTFYSVVVAPNFARQIELVNRPRELAIRLQVFPTDQSGTKKWFVQATS